MTFAAPLFLLAALAAAVPVLLHLIHRRQAKEVPFSTLRFLRPSVQRTRRRRYVDDLAVLAARVAALALIALGLARPAVTSLAALLGRGRATAVAVVLDNSASMALKDGGTPRFETARRVVDRVLALHPEGEPVALFLTGGPPAPELGRLRPSTDTVRQALAQAKPSYERADLAARIGAARALLDRSDAPNREIYVVTDNQLLSWEGLKPAPDGAAEGAGVPGDPVIVVPVNRAPMLNASLRRVTLRSPAPASGVPVRATVEVRNTAAVTQTRHLELYVDGVKEAVSPTFSIPPDAPVTYEFRFTPDRAGVHRSEVRFAEEDASPLDDRLYFATTVDQQVPVALLKPRRNEIEFADDGFYLERALAAGGPGVGALRVTPLTPDEVRPGTLSAFAVVFCVNLPAPPAAVAQELHQYARGGGHVVWVCGPNVHAGEYNVANSLALGDLFPAALANPREPPPWGAGGFPVGSLDQDHPALAPLTEPASLYRSVLVFKHFPLAWSGSARGRVLAGLADGSPLLVERNVGPGSVLMLGTGLTTDWTNLPIKPLFLPLFARLAFHLAGVETERPPSVAGLPITIPLGAGAERSADLEVQRPSGEVVHLKGPPGPSFRYDETHEPGIYVFRRGAAGGGAPRQAAVAVNIDPDESDPVTIGADQLRARFGNRPLLLCENSDELPAVIRRLREGIGLRDGFLAAVLLVLVFEVFLANRAGGRSEAAAGAAGAAALPAAGTPAPAAPVSAAAAAEDQAVHEFLSHIGPSRTDP